MAFFTRLAVTIALAVTLVNAAPAMKARDQVVPMTTLTYTRVEWSLIPNSPYMTETTFPFTVTQFSTVKDPQATPAA